MVELFIDESGSMNCNCKGDNYFIISIILAKDKESLKRSYKYFVKSHIKDLLKSDTKNKMFKDGKFLELKGTAMSMPLKKEFVSFLSKNQNFELFYIIADNKNIDENLYKNTARAFNYLLRLALEFLINKKYISKNEEITIQIDERNERTGAKQVLQEYLNMELQLHQTLSKEISVKYFDSSTNKLIQIADFFANLYYSQLFNQNYDKEINLLRESEILKYIFKFPFQKK